MTRRHALPLVLPATPAAGETPGLQATGAGTVAFVLADAQTGAATFTLHCSDACFPGCRVDENEVRCTRWSDDGATSVSDELTLSRAGALAFTRDAWGPDAATRLEAHGVLYLATWPGAL